MNRRTMQGPDGAVREESGGVLHLMKTSRPLRRLCALGLVILLVVFGSTLFVLDRLRTEAIDDAKRELMTLNVSLAEQTARAIEGIDVVVGGLVEQLYAENVRTSDGLKRLKGGADTHEILKAKVSVLPQLEAVSLIAADGTLVNFSRQFPVPAINLANRDYFIALKDADPGGPFLSRPFQSLVTKRWTLYLARRVNDPSGGVAGLVVGAIELPYFEEFYQSLQVSPGTGISLWWRDGMLLARYPALPEKIGTIAATPGALKMIERLDAGTYESGAAVDGNDRIVSFRGIRDLPLLVGVSRTRGEALAQWQSQAITVGLAGVFCLAAFALMLWAMVRQFAAYETVNRALMERHHAIEAREEAEKSLRQLQKLETLGQLTGGVAHDFNNLLQAIRSSLYLLDGRVGEEATQRALRVAKQAVERGATLTQHLLAFARRQQLAPKPVCLGALVAGMVELLERTLGGTVRINVERRPGEWTALVDPHQFDTALLNLAVNARDSMPSGGTLTISVANVALRAGQEPPVEALPPGDYVAVCVRDTGTGMPDEVAARAFEPFFTTKRVGTGSGLGLSMVHGLAAQSGGGVRLDSRPGQGTAVTMYLPRSAEAASPASAPAAPAGEPARSPIRVLLVEDDALVRMATAAVLAEAGMTVVEAMEGEEARTLLSGGAAVDILVTDFAMPGMNGLELARHARSLRPGLPVLIVTGYAENAVLEGAMTEPGIRVLSKPLSPPALVDHVTSVLQEMERSAV